jgi:hypothetical protein
MPGRIAWMDRFCVGRNEQGINSYDRAILARSVLRLPLRSAGLVLKRTYTHVELIDEQRHVETLGPLVHLCSMWVSCVEPRHRIALLESTLDSGFVTSGSPSPAKPAAVGCVLQDEHNGLKPLAMTSVPTWFLTWA